ncbi:hypothetical protein [Halomonas denitrificans]|nr:hypothetical protein [Halomonas denitrificans]
MNKVLILALLFLVQPAKASLAWWELCSTCSSDNQFQVAAIDAHGEDETVYVSNPNTLETRKYSRFFTWEDFGTGPVRMTHVAEAYFPQHEKDAFREALEKSQITQFSIDQSELAAYSGGLSPSPSALFDIRTGYLRNSFFSALRVGISTNGLLPTVDSTGASAGVQLRGLGANGGVSESLRVVPLTIWIRYPDRSRIEVTYHPDGTWSDIVVIDPEGNAIDVLVNPNGPNPVDVNTLDGDYAFQGENITDAANDFIDAVNSFNFNNCTFRQVEPNVWRLSCRHP